MGRFRLRSPRSWRFQNQLTALFSAAVLCFALVGALVNSWSANDMLLQQLLDQGGQIARSFARQSTLALLYGLGENAQDAARTTLGFPDVKHVAVYDKDGANLLHMGEASDWLPTADEPPPQTTEAHETSRAWHFLAPAYDSSGGEEADSPFELRKPEKQLLGYVHVMVDKKGLHAMQASIFFYNFLSTFITAAVLLLLLQWLTASITRPLNELARLMQQAEQGEQNVRSSARGSQEVLNMSQTFNKMMSVLEERARRLDQQNVLLLHEMEERKQIEQQLIEYRDHLQEMVDEQTRDLIEARDAALVAERAMSAFLANMSHELRTPLHGILSFASFGITRLERVPAEKLRSYFQEIHESGSSLLSLLNDLLDLSKLRAGKMTYEFQRADLGQVVHSVLSECASLLAEKSLKAELDDQEEPVLISMDQTRIKQVVRNLLSNAIKFSPPNATIDVSIEYAHNGTAMVRIADRGIGIPADEIDCIFSPFTQSSKTRTNAGGTGLGLPICKEIIEGGHHGWIKAENREGGGSIFTFSIPIAQDKGRGGGTYRGETEAGLSRVAGR